MYYSAYDGTNLGTGVMAEQTKKQRKGISALPILLGILVLFGIAMAFLTYGHDVALFNPKGMIANEQHRLMVVSTLVMLVLVVPVILTLYFFMWKYREGSGDTTYAPDTKNNKAYLLFAWGAPLTIVAIIAALMLPATQRLDPGKSIASDNKQITVKVVALRWKWLFIYPEQNVASVNFTQVPVDTPVRYEITADEMPMSSFWIPHLGGMLYSMTGHVNPLNLIGDTVGDYPGSTAEINGPGFAGMRFTTRVSSKEDFDKWVAEAKQSQITLDEAEYEKLLEPSENNKPVLYANPSPDLFDMIVGKYGHDMHDMEAM